MKKNLFLIIFCLFFANIYANKTISFTFPIIDELENEVRTTVDIELDSEGRIINIKDFTTSQNINVEYDTRVITVKNDDFNKVISTSKLDNFKIDIKEKSFTIQCSKTKSVVYENGNLYELKIKPKYSYAVQYFSYLKNNTTYKIQYSKTPFYSKSTQDIKLSQINKLISTNKYINQNNSKILSETSCIFLIPFLLVEVEGEKLKPYSYSATSELKEKNAHYKAENLKTKDGLPWACNFNYDYSTSFQTDDAPKVIIEVPSIPTMKLKFINGYQSKDRPDLYKANSRAKLICIKNLNNNMCFYVQFTDTPAEQEIECNYLHLVEGSTSKIEITFLKVYPGEKYKDLCIQAIIPEFY